MVRKVVFLGLDGCTWKLLDKYISQGLMPNLKLILKEGVRGNLQSYIPYTSRSCWVGAFTGTNPGKHGMTRLSTVDKQELPSIWKVLSDNKIKSIVINDITTYPPERIDGIFISGGMYVPPKSNNFVYPPEIFDEINREIKNFHPTRKIGEKKAKNGYFEEYYNEMEELGNKILNVTLFLAEKYEWKIIAPIFMNPDALHHFYWDKPEFLEKLYKWVDDLLGKVYSLAKSHNANLLIISDHGGGPINKFFLVNTWLKKNKLGNFGSTDGLRKQLSSSGITKGKVLKKLNDLKLGKFASKWTPTKIKNMVPREQMETDYIVKGKTSVYSDAYNEISVKIDNPEEYEKKRSEVIKKLLELQDEGKPVVLKAYKKEEVYKGPYLSRANDIQFLLAEGYGWSPMMKQEIFMSPKKMGVNRTGDHRPEGILIGWGPDIVKNGILSKDPSILDIFPTILHMLEQTIPSYVDGKVIKEIFSPESLISNKSVKFSKKTEKEFLKSRILSLKKSKKF